MVRDLRGVVERTAAAIGVLISLQTPTKPMREEAASAGMTEFWQGGQTIPHPRLQLRTVADLLAGAQIDMPRFQRRDARERTFKKAPKAKGNSNTRDKLMPWDD